MGAPHIDEALDRLITAYERAGLEPIRPAPRDVEKHLARIRAEIAPLRLPDEVYRFWRRVDPYTITVAPNPHPTNPEFALSAWRNHVGTRPLLHPRMGFPVCYESHCFLMVELEDGRGSGGPLLSYQYAGGDGFAVAFASLAEYVDLLAMMIDAREFHYVHHESQSWPVFNHDGDWDVACEARLASAGPLGRLGMGRHFGDLPAAWPPHWLAAEGLPDEAPRGATTTIADLTRRAATGADATGSICVHLGRSTYSATGARWEVGDATGWLDLWCPSAVMTYAESGAREFEVEVVVHPPVETPSGPAGWEQADEIAGQAAAHDIAGAQAAAAEFYRHMFESRAQAEARAIRPLD
ncbi:MAG TPA: hypothetical protein VGK17_17265 [Propionicimonas sp.]|jgi:hypothetical protein